MVEIGFSGSGRGAVDPLAVCVSLDPRGWSRCVLTAGRHLAAPEDQREPLRGEAGASRGCDGGPDPRGQDLHPSAPTSGAATLTVSCCVIGFSLICSTICGELRAGPTRLLSRARLAPLRALHTLSCPVPVVSVCLCFHQPPAAAAPSHPVVHVLNVAACTCTFGRPGHMHSHRCSLWAKAVSFTAHLPNKRRKPSAGPGLAGGKCQEGALIITFDLCMIQSASAILNIQHFSCDRNRKRDTKTHATFLPGATASIDEHILGRIRGIPTYIMKYLG